MTFSAAMHNVAVLEAWRRDSSATGFLRTHHRVSGSLRSSAVRTRPLRLCCFPKVISENPAKTFPTLNAPLNAGTVGHFADQPVVETLVISFHMVMSDVSANGRAKMILSERNDPVETLVFYRTNKTLRVSVSNSDSLRVVSRSPPRQGERGAE